MGDIVGLNGWKPDSTDQKSDLAEGLRILAGRLEQGDFPKSNSAAVVLVETDEMGLGNLTPLMLGLNKIEGVFCMQAAIHYLTMPDIVEEDD
jgi:hypothetical protein